MIGSYENYNLIRNQGRERDLLNWAQERLAINEPERWQTKSGRYLGAILGSVSGLYTFFLTDELTDSLGANSTERLVLSLLALAPHLALSTSHTSRIIAESTTPTSGPIQQVGYNRTNCNYWLQQTGSGLLGLAGTIMALPITYLSHDIFNNFDRICAFTIDIPTIIAHSVLFGRALNVLYDKASTYAYAQYMAYWADNRHHSVAAKRYLIAAKLRQSQLYVETHYDDEIESLITFCKTPNRQRHYLDAYFNNDKLVEIIDLATNTETELADEQDTGCCHYLSKAVGAIIGLGSGYALAPLGEQAFACLLSYAGLDSELTGIVGQTLGYAGAACAGSLLSYASANSIDSFTNLCRRLTDWHDQPRYATTSCWPTQCLLRALRQSVGVASVGFALASALPRIQLGLEYIDISSEVNSLFIGAIALSAFAQSYWLLEGLNDRAIYGSSDRNKLVQAIGNCIDDLKYMTDDHIEALYRLQQDDDAKANYGTINDTDSVNQQGASYSFLFSNEDPEQLLGDADPMAAL